MGICRLYLLFSRYMTPDVVRLVEASLIDRVGKRFNLFLVQFDIHTIRSEFNESIAPFGGIAFPKMLR